MLWAMGDASTGSTHLRLKIALFEILVVCVALVAGKFAFELVGTIGYVYPDSMLGLALVAFGLVGASLVFSLIFAASRLYERRFAQAAILLCLCSIPFLLPRVLYPPYWKFKLNKNVYSSIIDSEPSIEPKYHVFDWGNENTSLGGGYIAEALVYDASDEIARPPAMRSQVWIENRSREPRRDSWVSRPPLAYPPCKRVVEPIEAHFYYVEEIC
jgi:hypothetical protein